MKKSIIANVLVGTLLLSGCSGVSQESYNSVVTEKSSIISSNVDTSIVTNSESNSTVSTPKSSSTINIENSKPTNIENSEPTNIENQDAKQQFIEMIENKLAFWDRCTPSYIDDNEEYYDAGYTCSFYDTSQAYATEYIMFHTENIEKNCEKIVRSADNLIFVTDITNNIFILNVYDKDNNSIVSVSNLGVPNNKNVIYWENAEMREKYKSIEQNEIFKGFEIQVENKPVS